MENDESNEMKIFDDSKPPPYERRSVVIPEVDIDAVELSRHSTREDCWLAINGLVFDVTEYIERHPGGDQILRGAGRDATRLFRESHFWVSAVAFLPRSIKGTFVGETKATDDSDMDDHVTGDENDSDDDDRGEELDGVHDANDDANENDGAPVADSSPTSRTISSSDYDPTIVRRLRLAQLIGSLRVFLWLIVGPNIWASVFLGATIRVVYDLIRRQRVRWRNVLLGSVAILTHLWRRRRVEMTSPQLPSGVHVFGEKVRMIAQLSRLYVRRYVPHPLLWNGDMKTVLPTVVHEWFGGKDNKYVRVNMKGSSLHPGTVACDYLFTKRPHGRLAVLLPGIGGNADAVYVRQVGEEFVRRGWNVCVVNPRGLDANVPDASNVRNVIDAAVFVQDVASVVSQLCDPPRSFIDGNKHTPHNIVTHAAVIGFSLGGIVTAKYMASCDVPSTVKCGVSVSGAFDISFVSSQTYASYYQPVIVPTLLMKLIAKYGVDRLRRTFSETNQIERIVHSTTYEDLICNLSGDKTANDAFDMFRTHLELSPKERRRIDRPFLLMVSRDDPLHHADMIGANEHLTSSSTSSSASNENIVLLVTETGGHVLWPEGAMLWSRPSFHFLRRTVAEFAEASCLVADRWPTTGTTPIRRDPAT